MKKTIIGICYILWLLASNDNVSAIEGLKISVQGSNVVLSWPSTNTETYIVQYRPSLGAGSSWTTLTNYYPASSSNVTFFVHSNIVQYPLVLGGGTNTGDGTPPSPDGMSGTTSASTSTTTAAPAVPMVKPVDGSGDAVPMAIYPPGFDLYGYLIYDPSTGNWMSGNGYSVPINSANSVQASDIHPLDDSGTNSTPDPGFYRVVRDGVHVYGLTNGMVLSGIVQFPIEVAWTNNTDQIVGVSFYDANTNPIVGPYAQSPISNVWQMVWNTPISFNGYYSIYAELDFASNNPVFSNPVTVTVSNVVSFPNYFSQTFGNQMWIYAETITNTAFQIDIYDENTNYLGSFTGAADGYGVISFLWDLTDGSGNTYTSTNFYGVFTVDTSSLSGSSQNTMSESVNASSHSFQTSTPSHKALQINAAYPNGSSSSASFTNFWVKERAWSANNNWVVAYGLFSAGLQTVDDEMIQGGPSGEWLGVLWTLDPGGLSQNLSPGNDPNKAATSAVFTVQDTNTAAELLSYLADHRYENFYFFGHGNSSTIGSYTGYGLTQGQIADALLNVPPNKQYQMRHAAYHAYRFVMLDGCDTGAGTFSQAFAIPSITVGANFFAAAGVESRGFVGFKSWKIDTITQFNWENYSQMTGHFLTDWLTSSYNLQTCVSNAVLNVYRIGANMDSSVVIYGAADMYSSTHTGQ
jgi:hypothetical protein